MTYREALEKAKTEMGEQCRACALCNGRTCRNRIPGPGAKGLGEGAIRNYDKWQDFRVNMDTLCAGRPVDTTLELFGRSFQYPFFAGPAGAVQLHYGDKFTDLTYNQLLVPACAKGGIAAFTGDGINPAVMEAATQVIEAAGGCGIPTVKPWEQELVLEKLALVRRCGAFAVAMDVDAAGLPFLKNKNGRPAGKSVEQLGEIIAAAGLPFIVKGIMTPQSALKAKAAGAAAIVVSNHGGRVLDQCPATAEVLEEIVAAVEGSMKVLVDGGLRTGTDIFKALALGADGVLVCRPFVPAVYGGGEEGVLAYISQLGEELADTMVMCGAFSIREITRDMVRGL